MRRSRDGIARHHGALVQDDDADVGTEADLSVVLNESITSGRVRLVAGASRASLNRIVGPPDIAVEIVSPGSVREDTELLPVLYHAAGVRDYWLVDARKPTIRFDIFHRTAAASVRAKRVAGHLRSKVLARSFRLTRTTNILGPPVHRLEVRPA